MRLNQMGANIPYPFHGLPMVSTHDRLGYWALLGILEDMMGELPDGESGSGSGTKGTTIRLDCGKPPKKK